MKVLVDTSIWIESVKSGDKINATHFGELLREQLIVACLPVWLELQSGQADRQLTDVARRVFHQIEFIDPDWSQKSVWQEMVELAANCHKKKIALPGIADRMIVLSALRGDSLLATLDKKMKRLADDLGILYEDLS